MFPCVIKQSVNLQQELDEFDEMAFGLAPAGTNPAGRDNLLDVLNSRDPPPLRVGAQPPSTAPATKIPLDGLGFSDDDDELFPAFQPSTDLKQRLLLPEAPLVF